MTSVVLHRVVLVAVVHAKDVIVVDQDFDQIIAAFFDGRCGSLIKSCARFDRKLDLLEISNNIL